MLLLGILIFISCINVLTPTVSKQTPFIWWNFTTPPLSSIPTSTFTTTIANPSDTTAVTTTTNTPFKFILVSSIPTNSPATVLFDHNSYAVNAFYSLPPGLPTKEAFGAYYDPDYEFMTIDLLPSIINMSYLDAVNYVNRKCDELYGVLTFSSFTKDYYYKWRNINNTDPNNTVYWFTYYECLKNIAAYENIYNITPYTFADRWVQFYFQPFYGQYLLFPISCVGIFFGLSNIKMFLTEKSSRNAFTALVFIQSFNFLPWTILYDLRVYITSLSYSLSLPLFGLNYDTSDFIDWLDDVFNINIFELVAYMFSFVIEMIRFYKIALRILALSAPIWYKNHISVKNVLIVCAITFIFSLVCTLLVICHFTRTTINGHKYQIIPNTCPFNILLLNTLYITYGLQCLPEHIVVDELFPLGLVVLILDVVVVYLLRRRLKQINSNDERKRERRMTIFALADGLYFLYDLSRRILLPFYVLTVDNDRIKQLYKYDIVMYNFTISMQTLLISMRNDFRSLIFTLDMIFCYIMLVQIQKLDQGISSSSQNFTLFKKIKAKFWKQTNTNQVATINSSNNTHP